MSVSRSKSGKRKTGTGDTGLLTKRRVKRWNRSLSSIPWLTVNNPRRSNGAKRNAIRATLKARREPCAICGQPIDYDKPHDPADPYSFEVDEIIPVSMGGNPLDISNCRAVHRYCNQHRAKARHTGKGAAVVKPSRDW